MSRSIPPRDRAAEARAFDFGQSIVARAHEIAAELHAARPAPTVTPASALADLAAAVDRITGAVAP